MPAARPGQRFGGRAKGIPNKFTRQLKELLIEALHDEGGVAYLTRQAKANPVGYPARRRRRVIWTVRVTAEADKQADALDPRTRRRVVRVLARLAADPRSAGNVKALKGADAVPVALVPRIEHRRDVYC